MIRREPTGAFVSNPSNPRSRPSDRGSLGEIEKNMLGLRFRTVIYEVLEAICFFEKPDAELICDRLLYLLVEVVT
jgi:hypothetical protein